MRQEFPTDGTSLKDQMKRDAENYRKMIERYPFLETSTTADSQSRLRAIQFGIGSVSRGDVNKSPTYSPIDALSDAARTTFERGNKR